MPPAATMAEHSAAPLAARTLSCLAACSCTTLLPRRKRCTSAGMSPADAMPCAEAAAEERPGRAAPLLGVACPRPQLTSRRLGAADGGASGLGWRGSGRQTPVGRGLDKAATEPSSSAAAAVQGCKRMEEVCRAARPVPHAAAARRAQPQCLAFPSPVLPCHMYSQTGLTRIEKYLCRLKCCSINLAAQLSAGGPPASHASSSLLANASGASCGAS